MGDNGPQLWRWGTTCAHCEVSWGWRNAGWEFLPKRTRNVKAGRAWATHIRVRHFAGLGNNTSQTGKGEKEGNEAMPKKMLKCTGRRTRRVQLVDQGGGRECWRKFVVLRTSWGGTKSNAPPPPRLEPLLRMLNFGLLFKT